MAEYRDFFKLAHDDSYDKQPLVKLRDNDRIPDLRKYTMGDLRSWVAENSPGLPSVLPKGVIRASSQLANGIVTTDKIVDGSVTTAKLGLTPIVTTLPAAAGTQQGQVVLYNPLGLSGPSNLMVAGVMVGPKRRWHNLSAGAGTRFVNSTILAFTTHATPGTVTWVYSALTLTYDGGYQFRFQSSVRMTTASAANTGHFGVARNNIAGQIGSATQYGKSGQWETASAEIMTPVQACVAGDAIGLIQSNNVASVGFEMYYPVVEMYFHYLDA